MNNYNQQFYSNYYNGERFFAFPFLTGALVGGAAIGLTRPRPIYNVAPYNNPYPYYHSSYGYYVPYR